MNLFHVRYRNTQGTLLRILNAVSRRGLDMPYVQAEPVEHVHRATLLLNVTAKQAEQLVREWHSIVDVVDVRSGAAVKEIGEHANAWELPRLSSREEWSARQVARA